MLAQLFLSQCFPVISFLSLCSVLVNSSWSGSCPCFELCLRERQVRLGDGNPSVLPDIVPEFVMSAPLVAGCWGVCVRSTELFSLLVGAFSVAFALAGALPEGLVGSSAWFLVLPLRGSPANTVRELHLKESFAWIGGLQLSR